MIFSNMRQVKGNKRCDDWGTKLEKSAFFQVVLITTVNQINNLIAKRRLLLCSDTPRPEWQPIKFLNWQQSHLK